MSAFGLCNCFIAALRAIAFMRKRMQDQRSPSRKRSRPTRPATEQTPKIPTSAEATMHHFRNASILRCSDSAVEQDASTEHISKARLSTSDDVTLIAIFEHFANRYVAMPMVGTCRRIFITWTRKRRQLALEELTNLRCWLAERGLRGMGRVNGSGHVDICDIYLALCDIEALIR